MMKIKNAQVKLIWLFLSLMIYSVGCRQVEKGKSKAVVKIIFDTDMGSDCDDVGALALLHTYADMGMAKIIGCVYSSGKIPYGAGIVEAINIYHGRPNIPVGAVHDTLVGDPVDKMSAEKLVKDTASYKNRIIHNRDAVEATALTRQLLVDQEDKSLIYITVGHTKGLYDLLLSAPDDISELDGYELIAKKVKRWVALGALGASNESQNFKKDWNFFFNETAPFTKYLVDNFPIEIHFVDAGNDVMTGKSLKNTPSGSIVRTAYRDWLWNVEMKTLDDQRPSWDLATVYYAVEGEGDFLRNEGNGWLEFDVDKGCIWHREPGKKDQFFIIQREGVKDKFADYLNGMIVKNE